MRTAFWPSLQGCAPCPLRGPDLNRTPFRAAAALIGSKIERVTGIGGLKKYIAKERTSQAGYAIPPLPTRARSIGPKPQVVGCPKAGGYDSYPSRPDNADLTGPAQVMQ